MGRKGLREVGEQLDEGTAGLVVVGVSDMSRKIEDVMQKAERLEAKRLEAKRLDVDAQQIEHDAQASS